MRSAVVMQAQTAPLRPVGHGNTHVPVTATRPRRRSRAGSVSSAQARVNSGPGLRFGDQSTCTGRADPTPRSDVFAASWSRAARGPSPGLVTSHDGTLGVAPQPPDDPSNCLRCDIQIVTNRGALLASVEPRTESSARVRLSLRCDSHRRNRLPLPAAQQPRVCNPPVSKSEAAHSVRSRCSNGRSSSRSTTTARLGSSRWQ